MKGLGPPPGVIDHPDVALVVAAGAVVEKSHQSGASASGTLRLPANVALKKNSRDLKSLRSVQEED